MIFQNLLFKKLLTHSGSQSDIFLKFYTTTDTLWLPKTIRWLLGYTTEQMEVIIYQCFLNLHDCTLKILKTLLN